MSRPIAIATVSLAIDIVLCVVAIATGHWGFALGFGVITEFGLVLLVPFWRDWQGR